MIKWLPNAHARTLRKWRGRVAIDVWTKIGVSLICLATFMPATPLLVYNASRSVPLGFYVLEAPDTLSTGDLVLVRTPQSVRGLADHRRYLPATVPMLKHISALSGDTVCAQGDTITINGMVSVMRQTHDHLGRAMPWWTGCRFLGRDDVFLLNPDVPLSFDGRYFGVIDRSLIIGKAQAL